MIAIVPLIMLSAYPTRCVAPYDPERVVSRRRSGSSVGTVSITAASLAVRRVPWRVDAWLDGPMPIMGASGEVNPKRGR